MNRKLIIEDDSVYEIDEACMKKKYGEKSGEKADCAGKTEKDEYRKNPGNGAGNGRRIKK